MTINNQKSIIQIQEEFGSRYPFLKLEFFKNAHSVYEGSTKREMVYKRQLTHLHKVGEIVLNDEMTVGELEQQFKEKFDLNVQVFRKHGNSWIETTVTDNWSLQKQNEEGKVLSELRF